MQQIKVIVYEGNKSNEYPIKLQFEDKIVSVKVLRQWTEQDVHSGNIRRFFVVQPMHGTEQFKVFYDEKLQKWYLD